MEEFILIKTGTVLTATLFAVTSFPLLAQQPSSAAPPSRPAMQQTAPGQTQPGMQQTPPSTPAATTAETPTMAMSPVNGELVSKLDSKTAKAGDDVVIETKASVKTADGTEIPKGSKLTGHIVAAQPSAGGANGNSQVALEFDSIEMKGGQKLAVHSQIQLIGAVLSDASSGSMSAPSVPAAAGSPSMAPNSSNRAATAAPQGTSADPNAAPAPNGPPAAGTVVARNGQIAISTTSIPGVLLANNAPGQQDPRMTKASSILLGAKKDIELSNGTPVVIALAATGGGQ
jgi:hypothetical protein